MLLIFSCFVCVQFAAGQITHLREFTIANGAPSNFFNDIDFDAEGRAIFATDDGLYSFNGSSFKNLVVNKQVNLVSVTQKGILFSCDDTLFQWKSNKLEQLAVHASPIRDIAVKGSQTFVLGQNDWSVYKGKSRLFSGTMDAIKRLVVFKGDAYIVHESGVKKWSEKSWVTTFNAENSMVNAFPRANNEWLVLHEEGWTQVNQSGIVQGEFTSLIDPRDVHFFHNVGVVAGAEELVILVNGRKQSIIHSELQWNVERCQVDQSGGIWFLTQGSGCYYAENPEVICENQSAVAFDNWGAGSDTEDNRLQELLSDISSNERFVSVLLDSDNDILYGATEYNGIEVINLRINLEHTLIFLKDSLTII